MTDMTEHPASADELLNAAGQLSTGRIKRLTHKGTRYIVKSVEHHASLLDRVQKGDPDKAFARELALLTDFAAKGAPVPHVAASDATRIVMTHSGETLSTMVTQGSITAHILTQAGRALARLHALGLAHGRPAIRDLCWDGAQITFIDLEAGAKLRATPRDQARDVILLLNSVFAMAPEHHHIAPHIWAGYQAGDSLGVCARTRALARRLWWVEALAWPASQLHRIKGKIRSEFRAVARTRAFLLQTRL